MHLLRGMEVKPGVDRRRHEVDVPEQVMELLEMIVFEVLEESPGTNGMPRNGQVVNVMVPVLADFRRCRHAHQTIAY